MTTITPLSRWAEDALWAFARSARAAFLENPHLSTWTEGDVGPNCLFAVRWGANPAGAHAVLVLRVADERDAATIFGDLDTEREADR